MSLVAIKNFILTLEGDVKVTFLEGEEIAQEFVDHWFVKANSAEAGAQNDPETQNDQDEVSNNDQAPEEIVSKSVEDVTNLELDSQDPAIDTVSDTQ